MVGNLIFSRLDFEEISCLTFSTLIFFPSHSWLPVVPFCSSAPVESRIIRLWPEKFQSDGIFSRPLAFLFLS
ncbi:hypothetical protein IMY05_005G0195200 [Salix suchowensis]|nr:hypothetical protein IMY05_005G0195200 [Salix suchowensis]